MGKSLKASHDMILKVINMAKQGIPYKEIAVKLNIRRQYVSVIARYNGIYKSPYHDKQTEDSIIQLYKQYLSFRKVARLIDCAPSTVASIVRRNGIETKKIEIKPYDDSGFQGPINEPFLDTGINELDLHPEEYSRYCYVVAIRQRNQSKYKRNFLNDEFTVGSIMTDHK